MTARIAAVDEVARARSLAHVAAERCRALLDALQAFDAHELQGASSLPGWSRLTIACHLRYGTHALLRMTSDALAGRETSYYPLGRQEQRPATLAPTPDEASHDVLRDWRAAATDLDQLWSTLQPDQWAIRVHEPADNPDLGAIPLARLALARLTEVDVHGTDLGIGVDDWSPLLVDVGLPVRLGWLSTRRVNHRAFDRSIEGSWLLDATDGPRWYVAVEGSWVESRPATAHDSASAVIEASSRDLFALLLGRARRAPLQFRGDTSLAAAFERAFPGP